MQAVSEKYSRHNLDPIDEFFAMGRGHQKTSKDGSTLVDVPALVRLAR